MREDRRGQVNFNFSKGLTLCLVYRHGVCQAHRKLVSLKYKRQVGITGYQLDPGNKDCIVPACSCDDVALMQLLCN